MFSRKGRIYSFGSLTLVGLVASVVGAVTQSPEAAVAAGAATSAATQSGILDAIQDKGFEGMIKLLENIGAISANLGTDDTREVLIKVAESLNKSDAEQNHDIAKAVRQAILSIIESEKSQIADKDDKSAVEKILKTTEEGWAWVELLEQDNLLTIEEETIPYFFTVKAVDIAKIESPVKEFQWKLFLLEIARQNNCDLTQKSIDQISIALYKKFPQSLREVFAQDFANSGVAYGKLLLALVGDINASQTEILDAITDVTQKQDKYQQEIREWFRVLLEEIRKPLNYSSPTLRKAILEFLLKVREEATKLTKIYPREFHDGDKKEPFFNDISQRVQVVKKEEFDIYKAKLDEKARIVGTFREEIDKKIYDQRSFQNEMFQRETQERIEIYEWDDKTRKEFRRNVILGDPGLGKSWLLNFEANKLATEAIEILQNAHETPEETAKVLKNIIVPIHLRISDIASLAKIDEELFVTISNLASFDESANEKRKSLALYIKEAMTKQKNAVLLLDALDEVPETTVQGFSRKHIADKISHFAKKYPEIPILLTSRKVNYEPVNLYNSKQTSESENNLEILAFDEKQIESYVTGWFGENSVTTEIFLNLLENQTQTAGLSQNPLMLSLMCRLFYEKQTKSTTENAETDFPNSRCEIYEQCLRGILRDWKYQKGKPKPSDSELKSKIRKLERTTFNLFFKTYEQFSETDFQAAFCGIENIDFINDEDDKNSIEFLKECKEDGLLIEMTKSKDEKGKDNGLQYRFIHLTFQEYLTASYLAKQPDWKDFIFEKHRKGLQNKILFNPNWQYVLQLLGGKLSAEYTKDYIETLLALNGENGEGDILFRPFILANFVVKESENILERELIEHLITKSLIHYYDPLYFHPKNYLLSTLINWGNTIIDFLIPKLKTSGTTEKTVNEQVEIIELLGILAKNNYKVVIELIKLLNKDALNYQIQHAISDFLQSRKLTNLKVIQLYFELLKDKKKHHYIRYSVSDALSDYSKHSQKDIQELFKLLKVKDEEELVRRGIAGVIGNQEVLDPTFFSGLKEIINNKNENISIRTSLTRGLSKFSDISEQDLIHLLNMLKNEIDFYEDLDQYHFARAIEDVFITNLSISSQGSPQLYLKILELMREREKFDAIFINVIRILSFKSQFSQDFIVQLLNIFKDPQEIMLIRVFTGETLICQKNIQKNILDELINLLNNHDKMEPYTRVYTTAIIYRDFINERIVEEVVDRTNLQKFDSKIKYLVNETTQKTVEKKKSATELYKNLKNLLGDDLLKPVRRKLLINHILYSIEHLTELTSTEVDEFIRYLIEEEPSERYLRSFSKALICSNLSESQTKKIVLILRKALVNRKFVGDYQITPIISSLNQLTFNLESSLPLNLEIEIPDT